jgi:hypothetical protein
MERTLSNFVPFTVDWLSEMQSSEYGYSYTAGSDVIYLNCWIFERKN